MDNDRKYRQRGYMDTERDPAARKPEDRPKGPRPPIDITGPRLPRLVQTVVAARCFSCSVTLPPDTEFKGNCPKCNTPLHCCKQCAHFEPSTRFQCLKPIPVRIVAKDQANTCELFKPRVTVARDATATGQSAAPVIAEPRSPSDARAAFDNLFKK